jgi:paired amphipathic helix protein Sin3a
MNPGHRDGWPPSQPGASGPGQQQADQTQGQGPRLPGIFGCAALFSSPRSRIQYQTSFEPSSPPSYDGPNADAESVDRPNNLNQQPQPHASPSQGPGPALPPPSGMSHTRTARLFTLLKSSQGLHFIRQTPPAPTTRVSPRSPA